MEQKGKQKTANNRLPFEIYIVPKWLVKLSMVIFDVKWVRYFYGHKRPAHAYHFKDLKLTLSRNACNIRMMARNQFSLTVTLIFGPKRPLCLCVRVPLSAQRSHTRFHSNLC